MKNPFASLLLAAALTALVPGLTARGAEPPVDIEIGSAPSAGPENAPAVLVEFFDFRCGHCARMAPIVDALRRKYSDRLRIVYKPYMRALIPDAEKARADLSHRAAAAALAADRQGKFAPMYKTLLEHTPYFRPEDLEKYAQDLNLDLERFLNDLEDPELLEQVDTTREQAVRLRVSQTPTFFINGNRIEGLHNQEEMEAALAEHADFQTAETGPTADVDLGPRWDQLIYQPGELVPRTSTPRLKVGDRAPDFSLPSVAGEKITLSDFRGRKVVVLSFVPAAFTPVCSGQWPEYAIRYDEIESRNGMLLGITTDNIPSLYAWLRGMPEIEFPVLSDFWPHGKVADDYGVLRPESGMTERAIFVIDREGIVRFAKIYDILDVPEMDDFLAAIDELPEEGKQPESERKGLFGLFGGK